MSVRQGPALAGAAAALPRNSAVPQTQRRSAAPPLSGTREGAAASQLGRGKNSTLQPARRSRPLGLPTPAHPGPSGHSPAGRPVPVPAPLSPGAASLPGPEGPVAHLPHPQGAAVPGSRPLPARDTDQREGGAGRLDPALADGAHRGAHHGRGHGPAPSARGSTARTP